MSRPLICPTRVHVLPVANPMQVHEKHTHKTCRNVMHVSRAPPHMQAWKSTLLTDSRQAKSRTIGVYHRRLLRGLSRLHAVPRTIKNTMHSTMTWYTVFSA